MAKILVVQQDSNLYGLLPGSKGGGDANLEEVEGLIAAHNIAEDAHDDIRLSISDLESTTQNTLTTLENRISTLENAPPVDTSQLVSAINNVNHIVG